jgi:endoglucanase Acf2
MPSTLLRIILFAFLPVLAPADVIKTGAGSYLDTLPPGAKAPPAQIYKTDDIKVPMPTNDWWSSLAWVQYSDAMYPHPLAVKCVESGLRVYYPGANLTANNSAIFGFMANGGDDLILGHSAIEKFSDARVAGWSDWFVTAQMGAADKGVRLTFGHGSPFVYAQYTGGEPTVTFAKAPEVFSGTEKDAVLGLRLGQRYYALFAPNGSTWTGLGTTKLAAKTNGKGYFSLAILPDDKPETVAAFRAYAYAHVTGSKVAWAFDEERAVLTTTYTLETKAMEGTDRGTLFALYPHQWRGAKAELTGQFYPSVRGPMKLASGHGFLTTLPLPPVLPGIPLTASVDRAKLHEFLTADLSGTPQLTGDTYWLGKQLGRWATILPIAEQAGEKEAFAKCDQNIRTAIEDFLTANDGGKPQTKGLFAYDRNWGTLIGCPASFGSDDQLNDHHFHYGYFIRAAGEIARRDPAWASDAQWGAMLRLLIRDTASPDRADPLFPFLRNFDPYAGHSWASGHSKFADGNNNESSSEAVDAWYGIMLLGEALGDKPLRDLGAYLLATEVSAIEDYWFDVRGDLRPTDYHPSVVTMVWGGKGANGTWFSGNPEAIHGINFLPVTGASFYLGRWPDYARKNYEALVAENLDDDAKKAAKKNLPAPVDGTHWDQWADIIWMYRALTDPADALQQWNARAPGYKPEAGNSLTQTYAWITAFSDLGSVDRTVTGGAPFSVVFNKNGQRTHAAWNLRPQPRKIPFSDGTVVDCPAHSLSVK